MSLGPERDGAGAPAPSAARLRVFYARHPAGAVRTSLVRRGALVAVRAAVFRAPGDARPAATALAAWERRVTPPYRRTDATLRAAESRAIEQALAYLGLDEAPNDPPSRPPTRSTRAADDPYAASPTVDRRAPRVTPPISPRLRERVSDLDALIVAARHAGLRARRADRWRASLGTLTDDSPAMLDLLDRAERRLRGWIFRDDLL